MKALEQSLRGVRGGSASFYLRNVPVWCDLPATAWNVLGCTPVVFVFWWVAKLHPELGFIGGIATGVYLAGLLHLAGVFSNYLRMMRFVRSRQNIAGQTAAPKTET